MKRKMVRKNARYSNGKNAKMKKDARYSNGKKANLKKKRTLFIQLFLSEIKKCTVFKCSSFLSSTLLSGQYCPSVPDLFLFVWSFLTVFSVTSFLHIFMDVYCLFSGPFYILHLVTRAPSVTCSIIYVESQRVDTT